MAVSWEPYIEVPGKGDPAPIAALEERVGVTLPDAVRQVLLDHPGDATIPDSIKVGSRSVTAFGPILFAGGQKGDKRYTYSVEFVLDSLVEWSGKASSAELALFPFATNTASGYFCLDYRTTTASPPIVFVDLDYDGDESSAVLPVASDWQELTGKLE
ncbi:SMI1/KNR4 family protein [Croceibacterium mercuriale]|nr:SMI1/KNR4 family protein [Croceibacterium mercuriale]